jgi:DGQHR domain-containing protein
MSIDTLSITIPVPAIQGFFGRRIATYSTQIPALQIRRILGHDPRSKNWKLLPPTAREIYQRIQRPTSKGRREGVISYIEQRFGSRQMVGAFPAVSIGLSQSARFEPIATPGNESKAVGILHIEEEGERIILDGLGRISGCLDLAEESEEGAKLVRSFVLPVTLYVPMPGSDPLGIAEMGQLFMDFNFRVHPVPASMAIALDQSDIYIGFTNQLAKEPFIAQHGGMEHKAASLGKKSTALVVQSVLLRTVRGATEGRDFQESNLATVPNPNLTDETFQKELASVAGFFSEVSGRLGDRWTDAKSLHLSAPGWQALGVLHHDLFHRGLSLTTAEVTEVYDVVGGLDWSRNNKEWVDEAHLGTWTVPRGGTQEQVVIVGAGRNNTQAIIDFLRARTGLHHRLTASRQAAA